MPRYCISLFAQPHPEFDDAFTRASMDDAVSSWCFLRAADSPSDEPGDHANVWAYELDDDLDILGPVVCYGIAIERQPRFYSEGPEEAGAPTSDIDTEEWPF